MVSSPFDTPKEHVETSPSVADEVKQTTCYMCACRCGINVYLKDGKVRYLEGNPDHPVNKGVLCAKGSAGIMQHNSPARLSKPLLRVGERGSGEFKEIEWEEALGLAVDWLGTVRRRDPKKLAFFTGRDQSQSLTGWWAAQFGTPNFAAHGGFCSVNMAAAGLYTIGGSFWEFGEPDWEHTRYFMLFGVAEDHDSNPIKAGLGRLKTLGQAKFVSINPVKTGYSAIADEWIGLRPGTDGLFVMALIHELLKAEKIDWDFLGRYTNATWLVVDNPGGADDGLFARNAEGAALCWDTARSAAVPASDVSAKAAVVGRYTLPDGRTAVPSFELLAKRYLDASYAPEAVAERVGIPAETIKRIAAELAEAAFEKEVVLDIPWTDWAGRRHDRMIGRPVSMHAMRGISAHSNGFHTCRAIHLLQVLLGSIDCPGGFGYKAPFPKLIPPSPLPAGKSVAPERPISGMPLGFPLGPDDLLVDDAGEPLRIDKAYSWQYPLAAHGLMHMVIHNAWAGDPYPVDVLMMYMANMGWNSSMNVTGTLDYLTDKDPETGDYKIPRIIYSDAYYSEMVPYADLILPDTTYLERWDCISLLDRPISSAHGPGDAIRQPVCKPDRDVRPFQDVLIDLGGRLGLPGLTEEDGSPKYPGGYPDYIVNHERSPGIGPLAGWRGAGGEQNGVGAPNPDQLQRYIENGCFWTHRLAPTQLYFKHSNRNYITYAKQMGWLPTEEPITMQLYSEILQKFRLAARGHGKVQPPESERARVEAFFDPLPFWYAPFEEAAVEGEGYELHAITQRPMHMYHSWGSQNAWLRQITARNRLFVHPKTAERHGIANDDWVWVISHHGRVKGQVQLMHGVNPETVWTWNAIGKRRGAWALDADAPESKRGFLLNHIISELLPAREGGHRYSNSDPVTGQAAWYDLRVRLERCAPDEAEVTDPFLEPVQAPAPTGARPAVLRYGADFNEASPGTPGPAAPRLEHVEWLGNRHEIARTVAGVADGHGNQKHGQDPAEPDADPASQVKVAE
ncbi:molybdopterin oxidoreductase family protein [Pelagibius sp.]|uniref:molybdopterin oxidoreductase family protein n=1 Tax=Pelagibius sp. TaxID=1931238 RepID=UPI00263434E3|nr:molybdopterin oxidoreductase family protein [Pelagibius sp.]